MLDVVVVSSEATKNLYYLSPGDLDLKRGDNVIFETENGLMIGKVCKEKYQEKSKNLNTLVEFMKKDKNSLLRISMGDATKKDFDSRLKSEEASVNTQDKFKKENSAVKDDYSDNEEIYCPMY